MTLIVRSIFMLCMLASHVEARDPVEVINPDLSFDSLTITVPEIEIDTKIADDCSKLRDSLNEYELNEISNIINIQTYVLEISKVITGWHELLKPFEEKEVKVTKGVFGPMRSMDENLSSAIAQMKVNGRLLNDFMFNLLDVADLNCNMDTEFLDAIETYANDVFSTNNEFAIFIESTTQDFQNLTDKFFSYEKLPFAIMSKEQLNFLVIMASDKPGSSGLPEMLEVYSNYFDHYFKKKLDRLKVLLPDGQPLP